MKIVLLAINAKFIHTSLSVRLLNGYGKQKGIESSVLEYTINNHLEEIFHGVYQEKPDLLGISCYIWNIELVEKLCNVIKKVLPNIKIFLGGPEVTYRPDEVLEKINADFVISGQGEEAFVSLVEAFRTGDFSKCPSLTYYVDDKIVSNPLGKPVDMAGLPFPYNDFSETENRICYYEAQRGCPFNCQYCLSSVEKGVHFAPIEKVKKELQIFLNNKVRQVKFVDRTFNCNINFATEIVEFLIENDNGITNFHFEAAAELLTEDFMNLLAKARKGLFQLEIGIQTTNDNTLSAIKRKNDFERIKYCVEKIKVQKNVHLHLDLIAGLPKEDLQSFKNSFNMVHSLFPHQLQLGFLKILRGAGMEEMCDEYGIVYSPYTPYEVLKTNVLSFDDVLYLKAVEEMVEIFYNSNRFRNICGLLLESYGDDYFTFYAELANFRGNYSDVFLKNKNNTYIFLIDFAVKKGYNKIKAVALAKLDFILRERPRSTPSWAVQCLNMISKNQANSLLSDYADKMQLENLNDITSQTHIECFGENTLVNNQVTYLIDYSNKDLWGNGNIIEL